MSLLPFLVLTFPLIITTERIVTAKIQGALSSTVSALPVVSIVRIAIAIAAITTWKMKQPEKKQLLSSLRETLTPSGQRFPTSNNKPHLKLRRLFLILW